MRVPGLRNVSPRGAAVGIAQVKSGAQRSPQRCVICGIGRLWGQLKILLSLSGSRQITEKPTGMN